MVWDLIGLGWWLFWCLPFTRLSQSQQKHTPSILKPPSKRQHKTYLSTTTQEATLTTFANQPLAATIQFSTLNTLTITTLPPATMANTSELSAIMRNLTVDAEQSVAEATTAAAKVCSTPELLEGILSHLPVLDLVIATGVSKTLRNVIKASPELQRKLFMLPPKNRAEYWQMVPHKSETPDIRHQFTHLYRVESPGVIDNAELQAHLESITSDPYNWAHPGHPLKVVSTCPWLKVMRRGPEYIGGMKLWHRAWAGNEGRFPLTTLEASLSQRISYATEPWTKMFLTSPPCQEASMQLIWEGYTGGKVDVVLQTFGEVRCEDGITLALLADEISKKTCLVEIMTRVDEPQGDANWIFSEVKNTTLYDQIATSKIQNPKLRMEISVESMIYIPSIVAPTESEYGEMAVHGHIITPAR